MIRCRAAGPEMTDRSGAGGLFLIFLGGILILSDEFMNYGAEDPECSQMDSMMKEIFPLLNLPCACWCRKPSCKIDEIHPPMPPSSATSGQIRRKKTGFIFRLRNKRK